MKIPGFTAEASLYRMSGHYYGRKTADHDGMALRPAYTPINKSMCQIMPWLCPAAINVSWVSFHNGVSGLVIVTGSNFAANTQVDVTVGEIGTPCFDASGKKLRPTTDANGEFTAWVECDCSSGSITVTACDQNGCANGTSKMPC